MPPNAPHSPPMFLQLIPLLILTVPLVLIVCALARRKGRSVAAGLVLGLIPFVNVLSAIWLASLTDQSLLDEINSLKERASGR
jgi:hypothetical protein